MFPPAVVGTNVFGPLELLPGFFVSCHVICRYGLRLGKTFGAGLRGIGGKRRAGKGCRCGDAYRRLFPGHTSAGLRRYGGGPDIRSSRRPYVSDAGVPVRIPIRPFPVEAATVRAVLLDLRMQQLEIAGRSPGSAAAPTQNRGRELRSERKIGERAGTSRYVIGRRRGLYPGTRGPFSRRSRRYGR